MTRSIPIENVLHDGLQDPLEASLYLNEVIALRDTKALLIALKDVVDARGGISSLSDATGLHEKTLYRTLSSAGNPTLDTFDKILSYSNISVSFVPAPVAFSGSGEPKYKATDGVCISRRKSTGVRKYIKDHWVGGADIPELEYA